MYLTFLEHSISLHNWNSKSQLIASLNQCEAGFIILGESPDYATEFYSLIEHLIQPKPGTFGIGLCTNRHGLEPHLLLQPERSTVVVGFDFGVWCISIPSGEIIYELNLDSIFYKFLQIPKSNMLLIQHEIGIIALDQFGKKVWNFSKDVITKLFVEGDLLILEFMDNSSISIRIPNGEIINI